MPKKAAGSLTDRMVTPYAARVKPLPYGEKLASFRSEPFVFSPEDRD